MIFTLLIFPPKPLIEQAWRKNAFPRYARKRERQRLVKVSEKETRLPRRNVLNIQER